MEKGVEGKARDGQRTRKGRGGGRGQREEAFELHPLNFLL